MWMINAELLNRLILDLPAIIHVLTLDFSVLAVLSFANFAGLDFQLQVLLVLLLNHFRAFAF